MKNINKIIIRAVFTGLYTFAWLWCLDPNFNTSSFIISTLKLISYTIAAYFILFHFIQTIQIIIEKLKK